MVAEDLKKIEKLKNELGNIADKLNMLVKMNESEAIKFVDEMKTKMAKESSLTTFLTLVSLVLLIVSVLVFFGYKLYKSLADKERKRDEKRKMKQLKKKK